jgi:hypothetical protein
MVELVLGIALAIALWNWAFWMARKKPHHTPYPIRPTYIYVEAHVPRPSPVIPSLHGDKHYVQDDQGRLWEINTHQTAKCLGPVRPTLQRRYVEDIHGDQVEVLFYGQPSLLAPNVFSGEETFWRCSCCGNYERYMKEYCGECGQSKGI